MKAFKGLIIALAICAAFYGAAALIWAASAYAEPTDDQLIHNANGSWAATCGVMDTLFTGVVEDDFAVLAGISDAMLEQYASQGITRDNTIDMINYQVWTYCDVHWDNLVAVGEWARSQAETPTPAAPPVLKRAI